MNMANIIYQNNLRTEAEHIASGEKIFTDAPVDNNGKEQAFSPTGTGSDCNRLLYDNHNGNSCRKIWH